ncbi:hypothetical protein SAMN05192583_1358 [Sphingomonas gellani]|uniref:Uncharacterized protein n=1 Tax=Sphingomonas gellani TaxID=1166340 RepID=A0A1H8BJA5_9SPHN|nr:hypothetical protein [Sphingomonas gellani]SEM81957.1 hypothetical protein SAMN05192583_1358 [Sphingomonas gellani]
MSDPAPEERQNEIMAAVKEVEARSEGALDAARQRVKSWPLAKIGLGVGIGSAAIAGAVLFASRGKSDKAR